MNRVTHCIVGEWKSVVGRFAEAVFWSDWWRWWWRKGLCLSHWQTRQHTLTHTHTHTHTLCIVDILWLIAVTWTCSAVAMKHTWTRSRQPIRRCEELLTGGLEDDLSVWMKPFPPVVYRNYHTHIPAYRHTKTSRVSHHWSDLFLRSSWFLLFTFSLFLDARNIFPSNIKTKTTLSCVRPIEPPQAGRAGSC